MSASPKGWKLNEWVATHYILCFSMIVKWWVIQVLHHWKKVISSNCKEEDISFAMNHMYRQGKQNLFFESSIQFYYEFHKNCDNLKYRMVEVEGSNPYCWDENHSMNVLTLFSSFSRHSGRESSCILFHIPDGSSAGMMNQGKDKTKKSGSSKDPTGVIRYLFLDARTTYNF